MIKVIVLIEQNGPDLKIRYETSTVGGSSTEKRYLEAALKALGRVEIPTHAIENLTEIRTDVKKS